MKAVPVVVVCCYRFSLLDSCLLFFLFLSLFSINVCCGVTCTDASLNYHAYEVVYNASGTWTWDQAKTEAESSYYLGCRGYLATVLNSTEKAFINAIAPYGVHFLIGGKIVNGISPQLFQWVVGPEAGQNISYGAGGNVTCLQAFCDWQTNEPSSSGPNTHLVMIGGYPVGWDDNAAVQTQPGYIIEYGDSGCLPCYPSSSPSLTASVSLSPISPSLTPTTSLSAASSSTPSLTRNPTLSSSSSLVQSSSTRTIEPKVSVIQVGLPEECSGDKDSVCPDGKCVTSLIDCDSKVNLPSGAGGANTNVKIDRIEYKVKDPKQEIVVVVSSDGSSIGSVEVPGGTLKPGWTLSITSVDQEKQQSLKKDKKTCGKDETQSNDDIQSAPFEITVRDKNGNEVAISDLPKGIKLTTFVEVDDSISESSLNDICFGYSSKQDKGWTCLEDTTIQKTKQNNVYVFTATTDHLTSFGVFFDIGGSDSNGCSGDSYWIASIAVAGGVLAFAVAFVVAERYIPALRRFVGGFARGAREMDAIEKHLSRKLTNNATSSVI